MPLVSRIHEGLVFSNRDASTLLDKLVALLLTLVGVCQRQVPLTLTRMNPPLLTQTDPPTAVDGMR